MNLTLNIFTTLSARVATLGLALISSIILARWLGPEGRGLFALVLLLPGLAQSLGVLGLDQANAVYAGLAPDGRRALFWQSAAVAGVVGGLIALGGMWFVVLGAPGFSALVQGPVWFYLILLSIIPAHLASDYWGAILRGMNRILLLNIVEVGTKVASLLLMVTLVVWLRLDVAGAVWMEFVMGGGGVILMSMLLAQVGLVGRPVFDKVLWKRTWQFALPVYCAAIMTFLNYRVDQFIVAALLPPEQLGFYAIAVDIGERLWILTGAVATALLPHLTNSPRRDPALAAAICRHVMGWTGVAALLVFVLADVAVRILYSSAFAPVTAPLRWLLPGILTLTAGKVLVAELAAREKIRFTVWLAGCAALINIGGNFALIPRMGISGAALASSISYSFVSIVVIRYYLRETRLPWTVLVPSRSDFFAYAALWRDRADLSRRHGGNAEDLPSGLNSGELAGRAFEPIVRKAGRTS
jgi:O-antigen/teichoic acid export membrane protein